MDSTWQNSYADAWRVKEWDRFDLIAYQEKARETYSPKKLFELWTEVCDKYDRGCIGRYALEEMKAVIWPRLHSLSNSSFFSA